MNRALIDTDILSYYFKGDPIVVGNFQKYLAQYDIIEISLITYYEIMSGLAYKSALKQLEIFNDFVSENNTNHFGRIKDLKLENWKNK